VLRRGREKGKERQSVAAAAPSVGQRMSAGPGDKEALYGILRDRGQSSSVTREREQTGYGVSRIRLYTGDKVGGEETI
jgi:hypothetical protein